MERALRRLPAAHPELAEYFERLVRGELPPGWDAEVPRFHAPGSMIATRKASQTVIQWAAAQVPELVGGSADLAPSTLTLIDDADSVEPGDYGGRNLHFGIREHAMGAIVNGLDAARPARVRRDVPHLQRLHEGLDPARGAHEAAVDLRLHARLDRPRRGRPDAPADRAARGPAGDADTSRRPSRRRQRDRAGVALRARHQGQPDRAGPVAPGRARRGTRRRSPPTRSSAAPTCCATPTRSPSPT